MDWIHHFQLFLFDFDGLLVDTESLHYQAYIDALDKRGYKIDWNFHKFCQIAHLNAHALKENLVRQFPKLSSDWEKFYQEKKKKYFDLIHTGNVKLMPGAEKLLKALNKAQIQRCVVTNSSLEQTTLIASRIPALQTISHWVTRENYDRPKPDPECYLKAIQLYGRPKDQIIGFEDSIRGLTALRGTSALAVLICPSSHPLLKEMSGTVHFESLAKIGDSLLRRERGLEGERL
jgi:beta-phosphoglucomutase